MTQNTLLEDSKQGDQMQRRTAVIITDSCTEQRTLAGAPSQLCCMTNFHLPEWHLQHKSKTGSAAQPNPAAHLHLLESRESRLRCWEPSPDPDFTRVPCIQIENNSLFAQDPGLCFVCYFMQIIPKHLCDPNQWQGEECWRTASMVVRTQEAPTSLTAALESNTERD